MHMDVIDLIYRLKRAGYSQVRLAQELGVKRAVVNDVVHGRGASQRVATHIATVIGEEVERIWPGRYSRHKAQGGRNPHAEKGE
ncbi:DNA-binding protein [Pollutimonas subterranea]|uniref:DNA-binding protein n=1 Tax=Pollutimonas subterranea TaxID=2045210 RepID=A0A2N4TZX1_9BURK|nr:DNA-binding protein [Pollutimonas subterranea]